MNMSSKYIKLIVWFGVSSLYIWKLGIWSNTIKIRKSQHPNPESQSFLKAARWGQSCEPPSRQKSGPTSTKMGPTVEHGSLWHWLYTVSLMNDHQAKSAACCRLLTDWDEGLGIYWFWAPQVQATSNYIKLKKVCCDSIALIFLKVDLWSLVGRLYKLLLKVNWWCGQLPQSSDATRLLQ